MPGRITTFRWLLLMAAFMLADDQGRLSASYVPPICEEVCSTSTECSEVCYLNLMEYENGNDITCLEYGTYDIETCCGDGFCANSGTEDGDACAQDCSLGLTPNNPPSCGNASCDDGESKRTCPADCSHSTSCGDGICDGPTFGENPNTCAVDCGYADFCGTGSSMCLICGA